MSLFLARRLNLINDLKIPEDRHLFTADGKPIKITGLISVSLNICGLIIPFSFYVIENLSHNLILGLNFLEQTRAHIDFANGILTLYDGLIEVNLLSSSESLLRTVQAVAIPPLTKALIPVFLPPGYGHHLSLVEPAASLGLKCLALARAIVFP